MRHYETVQTDLVVPVKALPDAKSRLRGAVQPDEHNRLVLAVLLDTVTAAAEADGVRRVLVVSSDPTVAGVLAAGGFECVPEGPSRGLNQALRHGAAILREDFEAKYTEHLGESAAELSHDSG